MGLMVPSSKPATWQNTLAATPSATQMSGVVVTASGSVNTKGSWAPLTTSTTHDSYGFWLQSGFSGVASSNTAQLLDIGIGASTAEQVIVANILNGSRSPQINSGGPFSSYWPLYIPRGTRVSARIQGVIASDTSYIAIWFNGGTSNLQFPVFHACDTFGVNTGTSTGTSHTAGNSGAESTDAAIGSATTKAYGAIQLVGQCTGTVINGLSYHFEFTDGTNTFCEWFVGTTNNELFLGPFPSVPYLVPIVSGQSLQIQGECSGTAESLDFAYYCFY